VPIGATVSARVVKMQEAVIYLHYAVKTGRIEVLTTVRIEIIIAVSDDIASSIGCL
jgi:hypothetical protein